VKRRGPEMHLDVFLSTGDHDLNGQEGYEQNIPIEKIIKHPKYDAYANHDYDLALIKLQSPLTYNKRVRPVCFPKFDFPKDTKCYITGWGHTAEGGDIPQVTESKKFAEDFFRILIAPLQHGNLVIITLTFITIIIIYYNFK